MSGAAHAGRPADGPVAWPAPAKLNLFLHITGRRADGYHELQTLFQIVDLCDRVTLEVLPDGRIERPLGPADVPAEADLAVRAARALQAATGSRQGASIRVDKRIPQGAGLGGGSSDAATVLLALNALWGCGLGTAELARIGRTLGADVPVFIEGYSAWAEGVGERLTPVELPQRWYLILYPGVRIATREVFQMPELTRNSPRITLRAFFESGGRNDCERAVRARWPEVDRALTWLAGSAPAHLSGTGSCVFAAYASAAEAQRVRALVRPPWEGHVARGLNVSPVQALLPERRRT